MNFVRLLLVVVVVTLCGGLFGAAVGVFMGWLAPDTMLGAMFGLWEPGESDPQPAPGQGAAAGGVYGLVVGAVIAVAVGIVDQVLLVVRQWLNRCAESSK